MKRALSHLIKSIAVILSIFTSLLSHDHYISFVDQSFMPKPLSERGTDYFKKMDVAAEAARYGFVGTGNTGTTTCVQYGNVGIQQGNIVSSTTCGDYNVSATINPLSIVHLLKAGSYALARLIDINGHYYREDTREIREDILYTIDKERYQIYHAANLLCDSYYTDFEYLTIKQSELAVVIGACGSKKSAVRSAALEVKEKLELLMRSLEAKTTISQEVRYAVSIKALRQAIQLMRDTKFKHKKDKKRLLHEYEQLLAQKESQYRAYLAQQATEREQKQVLRLQQGDMQQRCIEALYVLRTENDDQLAWYTWCADYYPTIAKLLDARLKSLQASQQSGALYRNQDYMLTHEVSALLSDVESDAALFTACYGNQYQQTLHHEAIGVVEEVAQLSTTSVLYPHRAAIAHCAQAACLFNKDGQLHHAVTVLDFCWSLLSWGATVTQAVCEGAVAGVAGAIIDIYEHPVQATVSILIGSRVMLAYQLSKVVYTVADLGLTALIDYDAACTKWNTYLEPVQAVIDAVCAQQLSFKDAAKGITRCSVQIYAQAKLLNGLQHLYDGVKTQAVSYMRNNPTALPERYLTTPDGQLFKAVAEDMHAPDNGCPAPCINQYEQLKQSLKIEEFTSIIKTTKHGIQRLIERGFTPDDVKILYHSPDITRMQSDGAKVFIKLIAPDRYNIMIYNQTREKVITALKSIDLRNLINLGKNYGWTL